MSKKKTNTQADVLAVLGRRGKPLSAYDILGELRRSNPKISPPTIYRALAALTQSGRVHRLESLNAFIACRSAQHQQASIMSICDDCGTVEERIAPEVTSELSSIAGKSGFVPTRHVIEVHGVCAMCGEDEPQR